MWYWKMVKISCTDCAKFEEVLDGVQEESNILHRVQRRKGTEIGYILRNNCLLKRVIE